MRSEKDIVQVRLVVTGGFSIDMERVQEDPAWLTYAAGKDLANPEEKQAALRAYVSAYVMNSTMLDHMPSTNGPMSVYAVQLDLNLTE